jgi:hypothetical protein
MVTFVAMIWVVETSLQLGPLFLGPINFEDWARCLAEDIVHGSVNLVPVQGTGRQRQADTESGIPQLEQQTQRSVDRIKISHYTLANQ